MMEKLTREQLVIEVSKLKDLVTRWEQIDDRRRKEFAKSFNWYEQKTQYSYKEEREAIVPSWEQIFVEVGKLKAARTFLDFDGNMSEMERAIEDLKRKMSKNEPKQEYKDVTSYE